MRQPFTTKEQAAFAPHKTLRQIASETGRGTDVLRRHAKIHGLPFRQAFYRATPEINKRIAEMRLQGIGFKAAAEATGFNLKRIRAAYRAERNRAQAA